MLCYTGEFVMTIQRESQLGLGIQGNLDIQPKKRNCFFSGGLLGCSNESLTFTNGFIGLVRMNFAPTALSRKSHNFASTASNLASFGAKFMRTKPINSLVKCRDSFDRPRGPPEKTSPFF